MNVASSVFTWLTVISVGLAVVAGGFLGVRTARQASEPGVAELVIQDPQLFAGPPVGAPTSLGGFSGFGSAALRGEVFGSGELVSIELAPAEDEQQSASGTIVIRSGSRELSVRFRSTQRLFQLVGIDQLAVGDTVVIRSLDGAVTSLLRVPADDTTAE